MSAPALDRAGKLRQRAGDLGFTLILLIGLIMAAYGEAARQSMPLAIGAVLVAGGWVASIMAMDIRSHPRT